MSAPRKSEEQEATISLRRRDDMVLALVKGASVVEDEDGELVPAFELEPSAARALAAALRKVAKQVDGRGR